MSVERSLAQAVEAAADPLTVVRRVVWQALELIPAAEGAVIALADQRLLTVVCGAGRLGAGTGTRLPMGASLAGLALNNDTTLRCDDAVTDQRVDRAVRDRTGARSLLCVPLSRRHGVIGVLTVLSSVRDAFGDADSALIASVAQFAAESIANWADTARSAAGLLSSITDATGANHQPDRARQPEVHERDRVSAFVANVLQPGAVEDHQIRQRVEAILAGEGMRVEFQPILDLKTRRIAGCEALARFAGAPPRPPDVWFAEAHRVGLGPELELAAVAMALARLPELPLDSYLAVNVGPEVATRPELLALLGSVDARRVVVELTEHLPVTDYPVLVQAVGRIRDCGARLAIDDTGAGFAGLSHILKLAPDLIKLDRMLTSGIDTDPARQALAGALVNFAARTRAKIVAEGVETTAELDAIHELGIEYGQGYLLGRPAPLSALPHGIRRSTRVPAAHR
jgi:EAL domain-containing protein (putative c-di-GMP-specific phosphodiesterase class I)